MNVVAHTANRMHPKRELHVARKLAWAQILLPPTQERVMPTSPAASASAGPPHIASKRHFALSNLRGGSQEGAAACPHGGPARSLC